MFQNKFDYRNEYFKKNKGFLGLGIYFCAYCGRPLRRGPNLHIDHIIPKSKNQYLLNRSFNTTVSCAKCNLKKSDKVDYRIVQGYASKAFGTVGGTAVGMTAKVAGGTVKGATKVAGYGAKGALWTVKQMFKGVWNITLGILNTLFKVLLKNWVITLIILYFVYKRYL